MIDALLTMLRPLLLVGIVVGGLLATGYQWGAGRERAAHQAATARAAKVAQEKFDAEQLRGNTAVTSLLARTGEQTAEFQTLEKAFNELRSRPQKMLAGRPAADLVSDLRVVAADRPAGAPGAEAESHPAHQAGDVGVDGVLDLDGAGLSAGAVWMWNSTLSGTDQPSGACGVADTSAAACDVAAPGIGLADAWANHELNARQCAEDRTRHQALIDFICGGQACPPPGNPATPATPTENH